MQEIRRVAITPKAITLINKDVHIATEGIIGVITWQVDRLN